MPRSEDQQNEPKLAALRAAIDEGRRQRNRRGRRICGRPRSHSHTNGVESSAGLRRASNPPASIDSLSQSATCARTTHPSLRPACNLSLNPITAPPHLPSKIIRNLSPPNTKLPLLRHLVVRRHSRPVASFLKFQENHHSHTPSPPPTTNNQELTTNH